MFIRKCVFFSCSFKNSLRLERLFSEETDRKLSTVAKTSEETTEEEKEEIKKYDLIHIIYPISLALLILFAPRISFHDKCADPFCFTLLPCVFFGLCVIHVDCCFLPMRQEFVLFLSSAGQFRLAHGLR